MAVDVAVQQRMVDLVAQLAPVQGHTLSVLEGVKFMRSHRKLPRMPVLYEPSIVIVFQGRKRGYLGDETFTYDPQHFLVLSVPLPFESETEEASEEVPLLAMGIRINLAVAAELLMALDEAGNYAQVAPRGICATPLDERLSDCVLRLLEVLRAPVEAKILGPSILKEIYFRVLTSEQGGAIRAALVHQSQFGKIAKALRRIHAEFNGDLDVGLLAGEAGMSVPAFHANFKAVTQTSPIQYLKTTRLHKARLLMVQDGLSAAVAADRVGYESASQFSREFKRFFGRTPQEETRHMKNLLVEMPAEPSARYVTAQ